jgi:hypothetical protein
MKKATQRSVAILLHGSSKFDLLNNVKAPAGRFSERGLSWPIENDNKTQNKVRTKSKKQSLKNSGNKNQELNKFHKSS